MEHELLVLMASAMSREQIIERMAHAIEENKEAALLNDKDAIEKANVALIISCHLFVLHNVTDGKIEKGFDTIKKIKEIRKREELFNPNQS
jgi:uncharacterized ferredoxin-like protein